MCGLRHGGGFVSQLLSNLHFTGLFIENEHFRVGQHSGINDGFQRGDEDAKIVVDDAYLQAARRNLLVEVSGGASGVALVDKG